MFFKLEVFHIHFFALDTHCALDLILFCFGRFSGVLNSANLEGSGLPNGLIETLIFKLFI